MCEYHFLSLIWRSKTLSKENLSVTENATEYADILCQLKGNLINYRLSWFQIFKLENSTEQDMDHYTEDCNLQS